MWRVVIFVSVHVRRFLRCRVFSRLCVWSFWCLFTFIVQTCVCGRCRCRCYSGPRVVVVVAAVVVAVLVVVVVVLGPSVGHQTQRSGVPAHRLEGGPAQGPVRLGRM